MSALFPTPVRTYTTFSDTALATSPPHASLPHASIASIPKYPLRVKQSFIPRRHADFGDGGAYPELHLAQFPLEMGTQSQTTDSLAKKPSTLALQVRGDTVSYDAIVTQHHRKTTKVYTKFCDLVEKYEDARVLARPDQDEEVETATRTREALQALVQSKVASSLPTNIGRQKSAKETAKYIRYTPNEQNTSGTLKQRIIRMVEVAKDPMEPPKFQHTKAVRGPPSPPVPVLHSPPRKLTVADQQSWKIPPCISNWKNSKGFTIALDKRLAADGRGLQQVTVNDNFASLSEALAIAERKAREEVNMRAQVQKKLAMKQKEQKESELRELASKARMERAGIRADSGDEDEDRGRSRRQRSRSADSARQRHDSEDEGQDSDAEGRRERDRIRRERKKEREREMRMEKLGKKGKLARDEDRDISEKIALGQLQGGGKAGGSDGMFDSRLFNQSQGISSGFGQEDEYNVYSKPMVDRGKASVYRPKVDGSAIDADKEYEDLKGGHSQRFKADKQFRGTEAVARGGGRDGPVQFSYDDTKNEDNKEADKTRSPNACRNGASPSPSPSGSPMKVRHPLRSQDNDRGSPLLSRGRGRSTSRSPPRPRGRNRSLSRSPLRSRGRRRSPSESPPRSLVRSRGRRRTPSESPPRSLVRSRGRRRTPSESPSRSLVRSRGRIRSTSKSPPRSPVRSRGRRRSPSESLPRSRGFQRSPSGSPLRFRGRASPFRGRGRDRSARRGRKRSPSRSLSLSRERGRPRHRARSRSPSYLRRHSGHRHSPSCSRSRRSLSRSRSRGDSRKRRDRSLSDSEDDPFGLDQFLTDARKGKSDTRRSTSRRRRAH